MGVDDVSEAFAHLATVSGGNEPVSEHSLRQRKPGALEDARPDDAVEPRDVLPDNVDGGWPECSQRIIIILYTRGIQISSE